MRIVTRPIDQITPYQSNPRHNDHAVEAVAASIQEFGFRQPIVVDRDGVIIAGHTRWKAAKQLGLDKVPVHVAKDLTAAQIKAYRIADNQTGTIAEWDMDLLPLELADLKNMDLDLGLLGFSEAELSNLLDGDIEQPEPAVEQVELTATYQLMVECRDERHQRELYDRMRAEGLRCRVLTI